MSKSLPIVNNARSARGCNLLTPNRLSSPFRWSGGEGLLVGLLLYTRSQSGTFSYFDIYKSFDPSSSSVESNWGTDLWRRHRQSQHLQIGVIHAYFVRTSIKATLSTRSYFIISCMRASHQFVIIQAPSAKRMCP